MDELKRLFQEEKEIKLRIKKAREDAKLKKANFVPYDEVIESKIIDVLLYEKKGKFYCFASSFNSWDIEDLRHYKEISQELFNTLKENQ